MAFEPKKFNDIYEDMRGRTTPVLSDFEVGSVARTMFESFAYELGAMYQKMQLVYLSGFVDTAEGSHLDNVVAVLGIQRSLPDFAVGKVVFTRDKGNLDLSIPVGTLVATVETNQKPKKVYKTIDSADLPKGVQTVEVSVQALERGQEMDADIESIVVMPRPISGVKSVNNPEPIKLVGRRRETDDELRHRAKNALLSSGKANTAALENALLSLSGVLDVKIIEHFPEPLAADNKYGMIDVVVDAPEYSKPNNIIKEAVKNAVETTRAAGIYANIKETDKITLSGVLQVTPSQKGLTHEEHLTLEHNVRLALADLLHDLKMNQPLLLSKIMKSVLGVDGIDDLVKIDVQGKKKDVLTPVKFDENNRINAGATERFTAVDVNGVFLLSVASEAKDLPIHITFKVDNLAIADKPSLTTKLQQMKDEIQKYLNGLGLDKPIELTAVQTTIKTVLGNAITINTDSWIVQLVSWRFPTSTPIGYLPSFVEKRIMGELFVYADTLEIEGTVLILFKSGTVSDAQTTTQTNVAKRIRTFLAALKPEAEVVIKDLIDDLKNVTADDNVKHILDISFDEKDWAVTLNGALPDPNNRLDKGKIKVKPFEKAILARDKFLVAIEIIDIKIRSVTMIVKIGDKQNYPTNADKAAKDATLIAILSDRLNAFFADFKVGQDIDFKELHTFMLETQVGFAFTFNQLDVVTDSDGTRSGQTIGLGNTRSINMRVSERVRSNNVVPAITITATNQG